MPLVTIKLSRRDQLRPYRRALLILCLFITGGLLLNGCASGNRPLSSPPADAVRIATFNIHYLSDRGRNNMPWEPRKNAVAEVLKTVNADVIGFQEMETFTGGAYSEENRQLDWVLSHLPDMSAGAVGNPAEYPWTQPILYRTARFELMQQGFFFFSDQPDVIYTQTYDGRYPAFCSWVLLRPFSGDSPFLVFNIHFDYGSGSNRVRSAELVAERIKQLRANYPVVLLGDTNAFGFAPTMRRLKAIPLKPIGGGGSSMHFNRGINLLPRIDHIFVSRELKQLGRTWVVRDKPDGVWPSDHYPVVADFVFEATGEVRNVE